MQKASPFLRLFLSGFPNTGKYLRFDRIIDYKMKALEKRVAVWKQSMELRITYPLLFNRDIMSRLELNKAKSELSVFALQHNMKYHFKTVIFLWRIDAPSLSFTR